MGFNNFNEELDFIKRQVIEKYNPKLIILFGSVAKGVFRDDSDIDLCIILLILQFKTARLPIITTCQ